MYDQELAFAHEIADRAGEIALSYFRHDPEVHWKPDAHPRDRSRSEPSRR